MHMGMFMVEVLPHSNHRPSTESPPHNAYLILTELAARIHINGGGSEGQGFSKCIFLPRPVLSAAVCQNPYFSSFLWMSQGAEGGWGDWKITTKLNIQEGAGWRGRDVIYPIPFHMHLARCPRLTTEAWKNTGQVDVKSTWQREEQFRSIQKGNMKKLLLS